MKQTFTTEKDAEQYADSLLKQAEAQIIALKEQGLDKAELKKQSKAILDKAKLEGKTAIEATKKYKKAALADDKVNDAKIEQIIKTAKGNKVDELFPRLYEAINFGAKVANRGTSHVLFHLIDAGSAASLGLDMVKRLETELKVKSLKGADKNAMLQSEFVTKLLRDPGLWQVIGLQSAKLPRVLARFREDIGKEVVGFLEKPGIITTQTKLQLVKHILSNPEAVQALVQVARDNTIDFAKLLVTNEVTKALFTGSGLDASNIEKLLPPLLTIIESIPKSREALLSVLKIIEPVILDPTKKPDLVALMPHLAALQTPMFEVIESMLTSDHVKLLRNIPALQAYITPGTEQLIIDAGTRLVSCGEIVQTFLREQSGTINKVLAGRDDLAKVARELAPSEIAAVADTALKIVDTINPAELLRNNQEALIGLVTKVLPASYGIEASAIKGLLSPVIDLVNIVQNNRETILGLINLVGPVALGQSEGLDLQALVPHVTALQDQLFKVIDSTLTPENVQLLDKIPALQAYMTPGNKALIVDAGKRLMACNEPIQAFLKGQSGVINKVLRGQANLSRGVFENTDLTANEMTAVAQTALQVMQKINPAELLNNNRDALINLMAPALPIVAKQDLSKLLIDAGTIFLSQNNLTTLESLVTANLPVLLDDMTPSAEKEKQGLEIADFFVKQLQGPEFKALYREGIIPFLNANKTELGQMLSDLPALKKLNINGEQIVTFLSDEKTIDTLQSAYTAFRTSGKLSAVVTVLPAFISSPELRAFVVAAVKEQIYSSAPYNFLKRLMVGSKINKFLNECVQGTPEGSRLNLAEKLNENYGNNNSIFSQGLKNKDLKGLDFWALEFKSMDLDGFNFSKARFGNNKLTSFSGTSFKDAKFDNSVFRGEVIDLSNTTFDLASLHSIQPLLDKAIKEGKTIKAEGMKVDIDRLKDMQEVHKMKGSEFGKLYLAPDQAQQTEKVKFIIQGQEIPLTAKQVDRPASNTVTPKQSREL